MSKRSITSLRVSADALAAAFALLLILVFSSTSSPAEAAQAKKANRFIGANTCKMCHAAKDTGNQMEALSKMKHAHAFETLATDAAKKTGKEKLQRIHVSCSDQRPRRCDPWIRDYRQQG